MGSPGPRPADAVGRALQRVERGEYGPAVEALAEAVEESGLPRDERLKCLNLMAVVEMHNQRPERAFAAAKTALEIDPRDPGVHRVAAVALGAQGHLEDALFHMRMARNGDRSNPVYREDLIRLLEMAGQPDPLEQVDGAEERMYLYPDPEMRIAANDWDADNVRRHRARYEFAARLLGGNERVLDAACGTGYGSDILAPRAGSVVGIDSDELAVRYADRHHGHPNTEFRCSRVERMPLAESEFDVVVSLETLEHLADPRPFLNEVDRVLRPQGRFVVSTPVSERGGPSEVNRHHLFEYTRDQLLRLLGLYFSTVALHVEHLDSTIEPVGRCVPVAGFYLAACRESKGCRLPLEGDFRELLR